MMRYNVRDWIKRAASSLIDAKETDDSDWLAHLARVTGAIFDDAGVPVGTIVAAQNGTIVTYDGVCSQLGYARAGLHTVTWHVGVPRFLVCGGCGAGNSLLLHATPPEDDDAWVLHCEACADARPRQHDIWDAASATARNTAHGTERIAGALAWGDDEQAKAARGAQGTALIGAPRFRAAHPSSPPIAGGAPCPCDGGAFCDASCECRCAEGLCGDCEPLSGGERGCWSYADGKPSTHGRRGAMRFTDHLRPARHPMLRCTAAGAGPVSRTEIDAIASRGCIFGDGLFADPETIYCWWHYRAITGDLHPYWNREAVATLDRLE